jgi:hypothetical protein
LPGPLLLGVCDNEARALAFGLLLHELPQHRECGYRQLVLQRHLLLFFRHFLSLSQEMINCLLLHLTQRYQDDVCC